MHPLTALLVADHIDSLREEADAARRLRPARPSRPGIASRAVSRTALGLSRTLATVAVRLDPEEYAPGRRADDHRTRPVAA